MNRQDQDRARPTVVVVGGGYGGVIIAKSLDAETNVVLVEPRDAFVHNVGALRALVDEVFTTKIFLPYTNLLQHGGVERDRATEVGLHHVDLASGKRIEADYVVLATGSHYPFPAKTDAYESHDAIAMYHTAHGRLSRASSVLLLGAGPVGIELAGEIRSAWPDKQVTVLDPAADVLGDRYRAELRDELRAQLNGIGVELILGEALRDLPPAAATELGTFTVTTDANRDITADIWFQCFGVSPVSDYLGDELAPARRPDGFITVGPALQVTGHETVFAIGDVSTADVKMASRAGQQATVTAKNIKQLISGGRGLTRYEPSEPALIVPIGPYGGSGQLPGQDGLAAREMVSEIKGRDLMVGRYAEILGVSTQAPA